MTSIHKGNVDQVIIDIVTTNQQKIQSFMYEYRREPSFQIENKYLLHSLFHYNLDKSRYHET